ncbi:ABC transporter substrate-binding protein [Tardiphaga sp.]|jgi:peptide/nickel transport system substrate-binding protein|uniref:ABC transporter substrate-binding protein n=1 Tax=Tardiphaga sp. TaxID=1926292 RepID=UPI0037D99B0E
MLTLSAVPALAETTITAVMHSPLRVLDPVINSSYIVRNYGYMVYDTLLARDADNKIQPNMADKWAVSSDGKIYTFTLRDGLKWHDGTDVTAEDCIASIRRWSSVDKMGQLMNTLLDSMAVVDAKTFTMTFKEPTAIALTALSKPSGVAAFIMPKKTAETPASEPIKATIGSGPFRLVTAEFKPGVQVVFEKFKDYVPRKEPASGMAGGKVVMVDRVKWVAMPDAMTSINALLSKEIDMIERVPFDLLSLVQNNPDVTLKEHESQGGQSMARLNFSQAPFSNKLLRQAAMLAMDQKDQMQAQVGNPKYYKVCAAIFGCGSVYASDIGADKLIEGQIDKAAELVKQAKYDGTPVVILHPTDVPELAAMPPVYAAALKKAGFNVQLQAMDWQTVTINRTSREPVTKGGWSIFSTTNTFGDIGEPIGFHAVAANGKDAWFGWPDVPAIEEARAKFARTQDPAELKKIAADLQRMVIDEATFVPLGEYTLLTAYRKGVGLPPAAPVPVFWNMSKTGK